MVGSEFVWVGTHECSKKRKEEKEEGGGEEEEKKVPHDDKLATHDQHFFLFTQKYFTLILPTNMLNNFWVVIAQWM